MVCRCCGCHADATDRFCIRCGTALRSSLTSSGRVAAVGAAATPDGDDAGDVLGLGVGGGPGVAGARGGGLAATVVDAAVRDATLREATTTDPSLPRMTGGAARSCRHCLAENPAVRLLCRRCGHELEPPTSPAAVNRPGRPAVRRLAAGLAGAGVAGALGLALDRLGVVDLGAALSALGALG